jgi:hypothetical protein
MRSNQKMLLLVMWVKKFSQNRKSKVNFKSKKCTKDTLN